MRFALKLAKTPAREMDARVEAAAKMLKIESLLSRRPQTLSGGQRQRVAIGRAVVREPKAFLFDEPLSNLDAALRCHMRIELLKLHRELGATMVYVTHDQTEAMTLADRIVLLSARGLEQIGEPDALFNRPCNRYVAEFLGFPKMNMLAATVNPAGDGAVLRNGVELADPRLAAHANAEIAIGIRPRRILLADAAAPLRGEVALVERLGDERFLHVGCEALDEPLVVAAPDVEMRRRQTVALELPAGHRLYFGVDGEALPIPA